jgi:hypothetical protein
MRERGEVAFWHPMDGWGAVRCPEGDGVGFFHYSVARPTGGHVDFRAGQAVEFAWYDDRGQDGCQYRVNDVALV